MTDVRIRYESALAKLMDQVKEDRYILAAILGGSLAHDQVWERSDIDLVLISTDDRNTERHDVALVVDEINIHTTVWPRNQFKKVVEGKTRNSFEHSFFAKARLLFTRDPTIERALAELDGIGRRDRQVQLMRAGCGVLTSFYKARKWHAVKDDLEYTALWLLYCATPLAQIEANLNGELVGREVIQQGQRLNPALFDQIYTQMLNRKKSRRAVGAALKAVDAYLIERAEALFAPLLAYLEEEADVRSVSDIEHRFERHFDVEFIVPACEWLADIGIIYKASTPVKLTKRSQLEVEEMAFFRALH